jgi:hypothetical protein
MRLLLLILILCNLSILAKADTFDSTFSELRRPGQAVRNLGMGNTGVALSADENALYYNPAGLGSVDSLMLNLSFLLEIPAISELQSSQEKLSKGTSSSIDLIHIRALGSFSAILPLGETFTVGGIYSLEYTYDLNASIDSSSTVSTILNSSIGIGVREDGNSRIGLSFAPGSGKWVWGIQSNTVQRREQPFTTMAFKDLSKDLTSNLTKLEALLQLASDNASGKANSTLTSDNLSDLKTINDSITNLSASDLTKSAESLISCYNTIKNTNSYSIGFQRRLVSASWLRMTFGAVAHNVGHVQFGSSDNCPRNEMVEYDLGLSVQPRIGPLRLLVAADVRDFTYANTNDSYCFENKGKPGCFQKRFNWGAELGFLPIDSGANFISVRGGVNQNRLTWGAELNPFIFFRFFTIEYAHYTESMGQEVGDQTNTRDVIQLRFAF